jgi:hypothetical protein
LVADIGVDKGIVFFFRIYLLCSSRLPWVHALAWGTRIEHREASSLHQR